MRIMNNLVSLNNKICIVTGANSGIGKEIAKQLVELDAHVVMVVRNKQKGLTALEDIKKTTGKDNIDFMICDFASQQSIRNFVKQFLNKYNQLHVLINNHGSMNPKKYLTEDGLEMTFAVNHLGYFLLTNLLLDIMKISTPARIINVASGSFGAIRKNPLTDYNFEKRRYSGFKAYSESKFYNVLFTLYLAEKLANNNITVNTLTPGFVQTNLASSYKGMKFFIKLMSPLALSPEKAAKKIIFLAASDDIKEITGKYFVKNKITKTSDLTMDKTLQKELWDISNELTCIKN
ncbi:MAG: SDR family oxidoreductase [Asgard group archaeon]|nr:SDR family oxidoreductase [Asgard group archaeon]